MLSRYFYLIISNNVWDKDIILWYLKRIDRSKLSEYQVLILYKNIA